MNPARLWDHGECQSFEICRLQIVISQRLTELSWRCDTQAGPALNWYVAIVKETLHRTTTQPSTKVTFSVGESFPTMESAVFPLRSRVVKCNSSVGSRKPATGVG